MSMRDLDRAAFRALRDGVKPCPCGSGEPREALYDARGIFCAFVCSQCEKKKRAGFRPDIFTDSNYWHDEPIEEDE